MTERTPESQSEKGKTMLNPTQMLDLVREINGDIESGIEDLSSEEPLVLETDGSQMILKLFGGVYWTDEEEEIDGKIDLINILKDRLRSHKTQVDGMMKLWSDQNA